VKIVPYKLVLYETGHFFKKHKDSMSDNKMIGTIILSLCSDYTGGSLVIDYNNEHKIFNLKEREWVFLYGDLDHEVLPVESGNRITLTFRVYIDLTNPDSLEESGESEESEEESEEESGESEDNNCDDTTKISVSSFYSQDAEKKCDEFINYLLEVQKTIKDNYIDVAVPLFHLYGIDTKKDTQEIVNLLKPIDKLVAKKLSVFFEVEFDTYIKFVDDYRDNDKVNNDGDIFESNVSSAIHDKDIDLLYSKNKMEWEKKHYEGHIFGNGCGKDYYRYSRLFMIISSKYDGTSTN
jgi:hypothetical protein